MLFRSDNDRIQTTVDQALEDFEKAVSENRGDLATDQLLNLAYLMNRDLGSRDQLRDILLQGLSSEIGDDDDDDA